MRFRLISSECQLIVKSQLGKSQDEVRWWLGGHVDGGVYSSVDSSVVSNMEVNVEVNVDVNVDNLDSDMDSNVEGDMDSDCDVGSDMGGDVKGNVSTNLGGNVGSDVGCKVNSVGVSMVNGIDRRQRAAKQKAFMLMFKLWYFKMASVLWGSVTA